MNLIVARSLILAVCCVHVYALADIIRLFRTHWHPVVEGAVTVSESRPSQFGRTRWHLEYEYAVDGVRHVGTREDDVTPRDRERRAETVEGQVLRRPVGSSVRVHYNASNPQGSRLIPGISNGSPVLIWIATFVQMIVFGFALARYEAHRDSQTDRAFDPSDPRQFSNDGRRITMRVPGVTEDSWLRAAGYLWFGATFGFLFVVGQLIHANRKDHYESDVIGLVYGGLFGAAILFCQAIHFGRAVSRSTIVLDGASRTLVLKRPLRRVETIDFDAIASIESVPVSGTDQRTPIVVNQVHLTHPRGTLVLAEFRNARDADNCATSVWAHVQNELPRCRSFPRL